MGLGRFQPGRAEAAAPWGQEAPTDSLAAEKVQLGDVLLLWKRWRREQGEEGAGKLASHLCSCRRKQQVSEPGTGSWTLGAVSLPWSAAVPKEVGGRESPRSLLHVVVSTEQGR